MINKQHIELIATTLEASFLINHTLLKTFECYSSLIVNLFCILGQRITNKDIYFVSKYVQNLWYLGRLQILFWCSATEGFPLHSIDHCTINMSRDMTRSDFEDLELSIRTTAILSLLKLILNEQNLSFHEQHANAIGTISKLMMSDRISLSANLFGHCKICTRSIKINTTTKLRMASAISKQL